MVTITGFQKKKKTDGSTFNVLNLLGGVEAVKSSTNGKPYLHARKANLVCGLNDAECLALVNTKLPGAIEKQECPEYEYSIPATGEVIRLSHTYVYNPEPSTMEEVVMGEKVSV